MIPDKKITLIERRLAKLKLLGAGDESCADCLDMGIEPLSVCKKCIADTPAFTELINSLCRSRHPNKYSGAYREADIEI